MRCHRLHCWQGNTLACSHAFPRAHFVHSLRVNEVTLRHSLCANQDLASRFTLLPRGLGNATLACAIYSIDTNQGDGTVNCNPAAEIPPG